jgi:carbon-monoxide dehydrogenase medium subunit
MKPAGFAYHSPRELDEALALLARAADGEEEIRILAGGQSLVPMMNFRLAAPDALIDIGRISELRVLRVGPDGQLEIGAGTRQSELLRDSDVARRWPVLAEAVRNIGHPQIRSRGTVCGSLAHHDPAAELPALAVTLNARLHLASVRGRREVAAEEFFVSYFEVALEPGEMLVSVTFPALEPRAGWAFRELAGRRGDFALVGATCVLAPRAPQNGTATRLVVFGVGERPVRVPAAEAALARADVNELDVDRVRAAVSDAVEPQSDIHAGADYRRAAASELAAQCAAEALERRS